MRALVSTLVLIIAALVVCLVHEVKQRRSAEARVRALQAHAGELAAAAGAPSSAGDAATLESLTRENRRLRQQIAAAQFGSVEKIAALREVLARLPEQAIPELQFATEGDWHSAVDGTLATAQEFRAALSKLRGAAEARFATKAQTALHAYLRAHGGRFPADVSELATYFDGPIDPAVLERYTVVPANRIKSVRLGGDWVITQVSVVDPEMDDHVVIGPEGSGAYGRPHR